MTAGLRERDPADPGTRGHRLDSHHPRAPVLVLGLGNLLLEDDGVGLRLLEAVAAEPLGENVELVDGGTQGLALLGYLGGRKLTVILDAVGLGEAPGTVHLLRGAEIEKLGAHRSTTAHEGNALELLAAARLVGDEPEETVIVGIEPEHVRTGVGLSDSVSAGVPEAAALAVQVIQSRTYGEEGLCVSRSPGKFSTPKS
ncbi:MAG: hydrogenase maturation protease [Bryobacteraceae bacterium]